MSRFEPPQPPPEKLSEVEHNKAASRYLRGTLIESLADRVTSGIPERDNQLLKFHGSYLQDDRDLRNERAKQKLEPAWSFMVRVRAPGGVVNTDQWLALTDLARRYGGGSLRLTSRQAFELHGIIKWHLQDVIGGINAALLSTIAACGDVNRNVMCTPNPYQSAVHEQVWQWARRLGEHLTPRTRAYHEIWVERRKVVDTRDEEPIYGPTYLPRKFKIGVAIPPCNDVDIFSQDLGFIAIIEKGELIGFNVVAGGGMGMTHGEPATYPQVGTVLGFHTPEELIDVGEKVVTIQRDYGDRTNRKHARLKYTIDDRGVDWFIEELAERRGRALRPAKPFEFTERGDRYGWTEGPDGRSHLTVYVECGRLRDTSDRPLLTAFEEIARAHGGEMRLTPSQNVIVAGIAPQRRDEIARIAARYGLDDGSGVSALRRQSMACVSFPLCPLAMAEAERYFPELMTRLERMFADAGLASEPIVVRMTGCPNGCVRPYLAEIGLVGKALGRYNLYLGGDYAGTRLNRLFRENADTEEIFAALEPIVREFAAKRRSGEHFGDYVIRAGYVAPVASGRDFHSPR